MKYLLDFQFFIEKIEVKDTDPADIQSAKEKLNSIEKHLSEYPSLKSKIDEIYKKNQSNPKNIDKEIENLLGKDPDQRNPFAVDYQRVAKLDSEIKNLTDDIFLDDTKLKLTSQNISLATNDDVKKKMTIDLTQMKLNIDVKKKKLDDKRKEVEESRKKVNDGMIKNKKEVEEASKKISEMDKK